MFKKKDVFFTTFEEMAATIVEAVEYFAEGVKDLSDVSAFAKKMKEYENKCDNYTHTILKELNKTFITPIEREDIMALTTSLDDVMDGIEACASRFEMFNFNRADDYVMKFADIIVRSSHEIKKSIELLTQKKLLAIREYSIRINQLENEADELQRKCIKELFVKITDPIELMKRKEVYETLELTTDYCEDVANTLESIVMRNS